MTLEDSVVWPRLGSPIYTTTLPHCTRPPSHTMPAGRLPSALATVVVLILLPGACSSKSSYWDTLPVGIHGGIKNRPGGDIASLVKFSVVVIDPVEGPPCVGPGGSARC